MIKKGLNPTDFADYLVNFKQGMPPHGGLAIGLERLTAQVLGLRNVREAALFPRDRHRLAPIERHWALFYSEPCLLKCPVWYVHFLCTLGFIPHVSRQ